MNDNPPSLARHPEMHNHLECRPQSCRSRPAKMGRTATVEQYLPDDEWKNGDQRTITGQEGSVGYPRFLPQSCHSKTG